MTNKLYAIQKVNIWVHLYQVKYHLHSRYQTDFKPLPHDNIS